MANIIRALESRTSLYEEGSECCSPLPASGVPYPGIHRVKRSRGTECAHRLGRLPVACSELGSLLLPILATTLVWEEPQHWGGGWEEDTYCHISSVRDTGKSAHTYVLKTIQSVLGPCVCVHGALIVVMLCPVRLVTSPLGGRLRPS